MGPEMMPGRLNIKVNDIRVSMVKMIASQRLAFRQFLGERYFYE